MWRARRANIGRSTMLGVLLAMMALTYGCQAGVSRRVVEQAMSGKAGANIPAERVKKAGEQAIPLIFDVVRDSSDEMVPDRALLIMVGMTAMHTANPSAPYIREVLADRREPERVRILAAEMLGFYWESPEPQTALIDYAKSDTSEAVRVQCIASLGGLTADGFLGGKVRTVNSEIKQAFVDAMKDSSADIRRQTCESVDGIARQALYSGIELNWCKQLLIKGKKDKDYRVRRAAVDGLFVLESIRHRSHP